MKNVLFVAWLLLVPFFAVSQTDTIPKTAVLNGNKIRAAVNSNGLLFHDLDTGEGAFVSDDYPDIPLIKSVGFWAGGVDPGGNLKVAVMHPDEEGKRDFVPGYIDLDTGLPMDFNYVASVTGLDIQNHRQDFDSNGIIDSPIASIFSWPGAGNPHFNYFTGMDLPENSFLAPFIDRNFDGIYDPEDGDYPSPRVGANCYEEQVTPNFITWTTAHDLTEHTLSNGSPIRLTVQPTVFAFNCSLNDVAANTVYVNYRIINNAQDNVDSMFFGLNIDFDIGCPFDDNVGVSPENDMVYAYNSTEDDCNGSNELNSAPPIVVGDLSRGPIESNGIELGPLNQAMLFGDSISPPGTHFPIQTMEYYRYLSGSWKDGSPLEFGGDGYQEGTFSTNWVFPDNPNDASGWSELTANISSEKDKHLIVSSENFNFEPNRVNRYLVAFSVLPNTPFDSLYDDSFDHRFYDYWFGYCDAGINPCGEIFTNTNESQKIDNFKLYPNPTSNLLTIEFSNSRVPFILRILDFSGKELWEEKNAHNKQVLEVDWLPVGVYFLEGNFENGAVREKFIVQKD